ncbi:MAG: glycosyltransferase [Deltaproteobacteria bacterium]|nr:glycosyltransferase [Deltaproteobacteria bacterium]
MRALHLFPFFGPDLHAGSSYVQTMLSRALMQRGVAVEVLATCSAAVEPRAAFGLGWPADHRAGADAVLGVPVRRFPVSLAPPAARGHALSRVVFAQWRREEAREGVFPRGSAAAIESFHRRALARPALVEALAQLGRGPLSWPLYAAARRAVRQVDVVLASFTPFATLWMAERLCRQHGVPLVLLPLFHPEDVYHHFRVFYRCFARADALLAQTGYSAALFRRLCPGANPIELGIGVDVDELGDARIDGARFRQRFGLGDAPLVLFVGRKEHHKRYDLAVAAVDRLADPRVRLVMIGADVDRQPLASPRAVHLGPLARADLLDAYDACDVFVLPSEHESFGIVFLEAWMRGKPVIGNAGCGPVASLISAGVDGELAADAEQLAHQLAALLGDRTRAAALGAAGRAKVLGRYTWARLGAVVHELYTALAARRRGPE